MMRYCTTQFTMIYYEMRKKFALPGKADNKMKYMTKGVCSRSITFDVVDNKVTNVAFEGGCSGNTQGIASLVEGMDLDEAIRRMKGIRCGFKSTSCPDQLAIALTQYKNGKAE